MSLNKVIKGSFWLYVGSVATNLLGYFYWVFASRFIDASIIGTSAAIVGSSTIVLSIFSLGLSTGANRMLGKAYGHKEKSLLNMYFSSLLLLSLLMYTLAALVVITIGGLFGLTNLEIPYITILILINGWPAVFNSLFNSILRTEVIALSSLVSASVRLTIGIAFLYLGWGLIGVMAAYILVGIIQDFILAYKARRSVFLIKPSVSHAIDITKAGIPSWVPTLVATAGTWLGVLGIYGFSGSEETGAYYIAFTISSVVYSLPMSLLTLMFPILSGMEDGRKRATSRSINLTFAMIAPISAIVMVYPSVPLSLLGSSYISSSLTLQILLLGIFAAPIVTGFNSLIYAYGKYGLVTALGLASNIPRIVLYAPLVIKWGETGAALSYVSGYFFALVTIILMAHSINYKISWKSSLEMAAIPFIIAILLYLTGLHWTISTLVILAISVITYTRLDLIMRSDLAEIAHAFLSKKRIDSINPYLRYILRIFYGK